TVHTPLTPKTKGIVNEDFFNLAKPNLQIINVARGGIIDEDALIKALDEGKIAKAALDVFTEEPANNTPLTQHDKIIVTPHLGASTIEAQEKVAVSVANEIIDIFENNNVLHAVNAPQISGDVEEELRPFVQLSRTTGEVGIQLFDKGPRELKIKYHGEIALDDTSLITRQLVIGMQKQDVGDHVNIKNAIVLINEQSVTYQIEKNSKKDSVSNYIELELINKEHSVKIGSTVLNGYGPRIVRINDYPVDFKPEKHMLIINHNDRPGIVGKMGQLLGEHKINIASMYLGRHSIGCEAMMVLSIDQEATDETISDLYGIDGFQRINKVELDKPID